MEISSISRKKIEDINKGLWTLNTYEFYVEIEVKNIAEENDDQIYYRLFHQNELAAIEKQIIASNLIELIKTEDEEKPYLILTKYKDDEPYKLFVDQFRKMKKYQKVIEFLKLQGITKFENIEKKDFISLELAFDYDFNYFKNHRLEYEEEEEEYSSLKIYQNPPKTKFLTDNIQHSAIRIIGEIIQENKDVYVKIDPYIRCILGQKLPQESFDKQLNLFLERQPYDVLFDLFKLGSKFCEHFSNPNILTNKISYDCFSIKIIFYS